MVAAIVMKLSAKMDIAIVLAAASRMAMAAPCNRVRSEVCWGEDHKFTPNTQTTQCLRNTCQRLQL